MVRLRSAPGGGGLALGGLGIAMRERVGGRGLAGGAVKTNTATFHHPLIL